MHQPSVGFVQRKIVATSRWLIVNPTDGSFGVVAQQECERIEVRQVSCQDFAIKICEGRHRFSCDKNREQLRILPFDTMSRLNLFPFSTLRVYRSSEKLCCNQHSINALTPQESGESCELLLTSASGTE